MKELTISQLLEETLGVKLPTATIRQIEVDIGRSGISKKGIYRHANECYDILGNNVPFDTITSLQGNLVYCMRLLQRKMYDIAPDSISATLAEEVKNTWKYIEREQKEGFYKLKNHICEEDK